MRIVLVLLLCFGLVGCATLYASRMNRLSLGMAKTEVIEIMGNPHSTKAIDRTETLEYYLYPGLDAYIKHQYWIILQEGKVIQYGRAGDFGSSIQPDVNIQHRY